MINVPEASTIILSHLIKPRLEPVSIREAVGKVLGEEITADRDFPPFHRVTMDGIAIRFESWKEGRRTFLIEAVQAAGEPLKKLQLAENTLKVMTGAMLPEGTDTVIRYEDLEISSGNAIVVNTLIERGQNVHRQGQDAKKGEVLLSAGMMLSSAEIALIASVGKTEVVIRTYPKAAVIGTGDELVDVGETPLLHQVRRSNTYAIEAAMRAIGWTGKQFHLRDEKQSLKSELEGILREFDVIILSGGVSQGKFDFIPAVLDELGVKKRFHQVAQRPGKPFWFGVSDTGKTVFALPGNPVSTFMCFHRYIRPWVLKSLGVQSSFASAILARDFSFPPKLTYFLQVSVKNEDGRLLAYPDAGGGSGDFANLKKIDGFLELPMDRSEFKTGEAFPFIAFRH